MDRQDRSCPEIGQLCWPNLWMDSDLLASPGGDWNLGFLHAAFPKSDSFVGRACGWIGGSVASPGGSMDLGLAAQVCSVVDRRPLFWCSFNRMTNVVPMDPSFP